MIQQYRVVGTLTTIPGRYNKLLRTLKSLHKQDRKLDAIYLTIPKICKRLNCEYPEFPDDIKQLCTIVNCDDDYGPCTKILGALLKEQDPNTVIISFDDDIVYSPKLVYSMLKYHNKYPNSALGSTGMLVKYGFPFYSWVTNFGNTKWSWNLFTGFHIPNDGRPVDILYGYCSILYVRNFFPSKDQVYDKLLKYTLMDKDVYLNDDVLLSAYLCNNQIERRLVGNIPKPNETLVKDDQIDKLDGNEISYNPITFYSRYRRSVAKVFEWGLLNNYENVGYDETIAGNIIIITFFVALLILSLIFLCLLWYFYGAETIPGYFNYNF